MTEPIEISAIAVSELNPGDVLVVTTGPGRTISRAIAQQIKDELRHRLGGVANEVVVLDGAKLGIVRAVDIDRRRSALYDIEHMLTLALQAMATNDCCADPDDPDWRGPAIEQFRTDLLALGVTPKELEVAGITNSEPVRSCRGCGCTDDDCSGCIERTGTPCSWVDRDLCSACAP